MESGLADDGLFRLTPSDGVTIRLLCRGMLGKCTSLFQGKVKIVGRTGVFSRRVHENERESGG